jgi:hypothetical protein
MISCMIGSACCIWAASICCSNVISATIPHSTAPHRPRPRTATGRGRGVSEPTFCCVSFPSDRDPTDRLEAAPCSHGRCCVVVARHNRLAIVVGIVVVRGDRVEKEEADTRIAVVVLRSEEGTEPNADMAGGELGDNQDELVSKPSNNDCRKRNKHTKCLLNRTQASPGRVSPYPVEAQASGSVVGRPGSWGSTQVMRLELSTRAMTPGLGRARATRLKHHRPACVG